MTCRRVNNDNIWIWTIPSTQTWELSQALFTNFCYDLGFVKLRCVVDRLETSSFLQKHRNAVRALSSGCIVNCDNALKVSSYWMHCLQNAFGFYEAPAWHRAVSYQDALDWGVSFLQPAMLHGNVSAAHRYIRLWCGLR